MASDDQFTALGPAIIGFQTHGANIDNGADIAGTKVGVRSSCDTGNAIEAFSKEAGGVGVFGAVDTQGTDFKGLAERGLLNQTDAGISGVGPIGVRGGGFRFGILGEGHNSGIDLIHGGVGVKGTSNFDDGVVGESSVIGKSGVFGSNTRGIGVRGHSDVSRGGLFESASAAQVQLIPHKPVASIPDQPFPARALNPKGHERALPANGQAGDLLCTSMQGSTGKAVAALWFCVRDGDKADPAKWHQVLLGPEVIGQG